MLRLVLSAVALAGVPETVRPVFADPLAATASDRGQAAAAAVEQPPAPTWSVVIGFGGASRRECQARQRYRPRWVDLAGLGKCYSPGESGHELYCGRWRAAVGIACRYRPRRCRRQETAKRSTRHPAL